MIMVIFLFIGTNPVEDKSFILLFLWVGHLACVVNLYGREKHDNESE